MRKLVRQDATFPIARYLDAALRIFDRLRDAARRDVAGDQTRGRSESTTMRYSQPPFKDLFLSLESTNNKLRRLDSPLDVEMRRCHTHMRGIGHGGVLRPVYPDRDFTSGRAELLIQSAVRSYPHVVFRYAHLRL